MKYQANKLSRDGCKIIFMPETLIDSNLQQPELTRPFLNS